MKGKKNYISAGVMRRKKHCFNESSAVFIEENNMQKKKILKASCILTLKFSIPNFYNCFS